MKVYILTESQLENILDKLGELFNHLEYEAQASHNDDLVKKDAIEEMEKVHNIICAITKIQITQNNTIQC